MDNQSALVYNVNTYTSFSHNHLIAVLSSNDAEYKYDVLESEEVYSRFIVRSGIDVFHLLKQLIDDNNGTSISIEYGSN